MYSRDRPLKEIDLEKRKKLYKANILILLMFTGLYRLAEFLLVAQNLTFRNDVIFCCGTIFVFLIAVFIIQNFYFLLSIEGEKARKRSMKILLRAATFIAIFAVAFSLVMALIYGVLFLAYTYKEEYLVEQNGKMMVSYTDKYPRKVVEYYDYKNLFVRGSRLRILEDRENGRVVEGERYTYYDDEGNVISSMQAEE